MAQTDVRMSELSDRAREYKFPVNIEAPYDGQIVYLDLDADWEYEIIEGKARLNAGELNLSLKIQGVDVAGFDPWNITSGATQTESGPTQAPVVSKGEQLRVEIEVTTGMTTPEMFKFELLCRVTKDLT